MVNNYLQTKSTHLTVSVCPAKTRVFVYLAASHNLTVLSELAVARVAPS